MTWTFTLIDVPLRTLLEANSLKLRLSVIIQLL
jgi:hypothetical protein